MGIFTRSQPKAFQNQKVVMETDAASSSLAAVKAGVVASTVILAPVVTEKSAHLASCAQYVFQVDIHANKIQVRDAIRTMYGVTPLSVNIQHQIGKSVRFGRTRGVRKATKKAIVILPKDKRIEVYEGV